MPLADVALCLPVVRVVCDIGLPGTNMEIPLQLGISFRDKFLLQKEGNIAVFRYFSIFAVFQNKAYASLAYCGTVYSVFFFLICVLGGIFWCPIFKC